MTYRLPNGEDLRRLAAANYFELNDQELADFLEIMPGMFGAYEDLERMPLPEAPLKYRDRQPGPRPSPQEDPFNAIVRRCRVRGAASGKLAGKKVGLKDNISVAGIPMTSGSLLLTGYVPETDATVVTRLLDAGAEIVAMLNMDNFAYSGAGDTSAWGATRNPHNPNHLAGGSSGGSAAALYYKDFNITIGGDQGGSIRVPASWCGVVGLKPTYGLVPYVGIGGLENSFDHTGPMARTAGDIALALEVIAGKDPLDPRQRDVPVQPYTQLLGEGIKGLRVAALTEGFGLEASMPEVDSLVRRGLKSLGELGAKVTQVSIPAHLQGGAILWGLATEGTTALFQANGMGYGWQGLYNPAFAETMGKARRAQANDFPPTLKFAMLVGTYMSERYHGRVYARAQNLRRGLTAAYDRALEQADVLIMPTTPMTAHRYEPGISPKGMISHGWNMFQNTGPFDVSGHPALTIPCGKSNGLPVGMMLVGRHFDDGTLLRVAHAFEQHVKWETLS